jgi:hypothetical protein
MSERGDIIDQAAALEQQLTDAYIAHARGALSNLLATGQCYNCENPLHAPHRFCDAECRDDFEHRTYLQRRNGLGNNLK